MSDQAVPFLAHAACSMQDALAQEIEIGAAVHAALNKLEAVDLPLDGAVALGRGLIKLAASPAELRA